VPDSVSTDDAVCVAVRLRDAETDVATESDSDAPMLDDADGARELEGVTARDADADCSAERVGEAVIVRVYRLGVGVGGALAVWPRVMLFVTTVAVAVMGGVAVGTSDAVRLDVAVRVGGGDTVFDVVAVVECEADAASEDVADRRMESDAVGAADRDAVRPTVALCVASGEAVEEMRALSDAVAARLREADAGSVALVDAMSDAEAVAAALRLGDGCGDAVSECC
jgi:hypothetical protein